MGIELALLVFAFAFVFEFFDASAGMGFGTLTPVLLLLGFRVGEVVPAVILASAVLSLIAGFLHHGFDNVDFLRDRNRNIVLLLIVCGILGILGGVALSVNLPEALLQGYIALLMISMGALVLLRKHSKMKFKWSRLIGFAVLASFNKGMSGGGYGPVLASGQILSGLKTKVSVGMTALSEGVVSLVGFGAFMFFNSMHMNWLLTLTIVTGGVIASPLSAYLMSRVRSKYVTVAIGVLSIVLGGSVLVRLLV